MRFLFYCAVLLVAAGSVVFGLDWVSAPMPAMPENKNIVFVPPPPPSPPPRAAPVPAAVPSSPSVPQPVPVAPSAPPAPVAAAPNPPAEASPPPVVAAASRLRCDVDVCAAAYRSFRESDCTYNPSFGPRRLCIKGDPAKFANETPAAPPPPVNPAAAAAEPGSIVAPEPGSSSSAGLSAGRCNVSACATAYPRSFREADCTFNPGSGPRRVCEK